MRGKLAVLAAGRPHLRIIPAHAGQTNTCLSRRPDRSDHPRACGANTQDEQIGVLAVGSSPRMRGKLVRQKIEIVVIRIIPAHAGQTRYDAPPLLIIADHPRACGANRRQGRCLRPEDGSSPRMRGKRNTTLPDSRVDRIIPAHAGQTMASWCACT